MQGYDPTKASPVNSAAPVANAMGYKHIYDFASFIQEFNIVGLGIASIVATNTVDAGRAITESIVIPLVNAVTTGKPPRFSFKEVASTGITFLVTMLIIFVLIRMFNVTMSKPVTFVRVVNFGDMSNPEPVAGSMMVAPVAGIRRQPPPVKRKPPQQNMAATASY